MKKLILRSENKKNERRTPLTPSNAKQLVEAGVDVAVENSPDRIFSIEDYAASGCKISEAGSWKSSPTDTVVLGLKELPVNDEPLRHQHIYFAHIYKGQENCEKVFEQYKAGRGKLYDLEYLTDSAGRRIAAFGYWAGFVGAAIALKAFYEYKNKKSFSPIEFFSSKEKLIEDIRLSKETYNEQVKAIIIGALGRCGQGASELLENFDIKITKWDYQETKEGGPFNEILNNDVFINAVLVRNKIPPFLDTNILKRNNKLSIIGDISCDPNTELNPIPIYTQTTTWKNPLTKIEGSNTDLNLLAVDNLPSALPKESSIDFSDQLLPHLQRFLLDDNEQTPWNSAIEVFNQFVE